MFLEEPRYPFYIDAYGCEGFSGGPVVFLPLGMGEYRVAGVVSHIKDFPDQKDTNSGFVAAFDIAHAIDLINCSRS